MSRARPSDGAGRDRAPGDEPPPPASAEVEVAVIGAGLVGAACALRLALAGRQVTLYDPLGAGHGASFGNAGHIATEQVQPLPSPQLIASLGRLLLAPDGPLRLRPAYLLAILPWLARFTWAARPAAFARGCAALLALQRGALQDLRALLAMAGLGGRLHERGYLRIWHGADGERAAVAAAQALAAHGVRTERLDAGAVRAQAPGLGAAAGGAIRYPDTAHVDDPHAVCVGLVEAARRAGAQLRREPVQALVHGRGSGATLAFAGGRQVRARQVILCAGAWSRPLAASLGYRVPLDTERGYHITLPWPAGTGPDDWLQVPVASTERDVIMTPMAMGLRMTGTVEFGGLALAPDPRRHALLQASLAALLPAYPQTAVSTWMGFRPSLPDHLPVLGAAPAHPGVWFAFGHQHLGLTLCGVTARVMAALVQGQPPELDLHPYRVDRF